MKTVTLCGSCRFQNEMKLCNKLLTMAGVVCISMGSYPSDNDDNKDWYSQTQKELFDLVHLDKVLKADCVLVVDTFIGDVPFDHQKPYAGFSTAREILWASLNDIPVAFLSDLLPGSKSAEQAIQDLVDAMIDGSVLCPTVDSILPLLEHALGRQTTAEAVDTTKTDVMHAALSAIAEGRRPETALDSPEVAADALTFLDLEVMPPDLRTKYLLMIDPNSSIDAESQVVGG